MTERDEGRREVLSSLSRTLVSIRVAAGCSIFDANAKPSEKVNANAELDTRAGAPRSVSENLQKLEKQISFL